MRLDLASFVANDLYCLDDHYESVTLQLWRTLARQASLILDVGSHIGTFSLVATAANPQARIVAVEADPNNFARLHQHCALYPNGHLRKLMQKFRKIALSARARC